MVGFIFFKELILSYCYGRWGDGPQVDAGRLDGHEVGGVKCQKQHQQSDSGSVLDTGGHIGAPRQAPC